MNKQIAEILVECGYAKDINKDKGQYIVAINVPVTIWVWCDPFADTLEGRRQADALEEYLMDERPKIWFASGPHICLISTRRQRRLDRIKWCFEQRRRSLL